MADMALYLLDERGLPDLTMRHLATALGVQPSALYWHFPNKQALLAAVSERILAPVGEVTVENLSVPAAVLVVGARMHASLLAHRDASELVSSSLALGLVDSPVRLPLLTVGRAQGVPDTLSEVAAEAVMHFVVGFTFHEQQRLVADALGLLETDEISSGHDTFTDALTMIAQGLAASLDRHQGPPAPTGESQAP
ncbi:TetR family transcriptional regulator BioQ [Kineosporia mesophila]|uniref:TetR family transcriptional regulator BioQ n=1 Tax=Kineosporia mesophila TaxID=566012 RepID=A0ABP6Z8D2_9ACTN